MTVQTQFAIGATPLGSFGVAWTERGVVQTWLHGQTAERTRALIRRALPTAIEAGPSPEVDRALTEVAALLSGAKPDLREIRLDTERIPGFDRRVYEVARSIDPGATMTYGELAKALGEEPMRARDVGIALARNPFAPIVPCHRIVAAGGKLGGYSARGGAATKRRLLELEGAAIVAAPLQTGMFDTAGAS